MSQTTPRNMSKKKYVRPKDRRQGLEVKKRSTEEVAQPNQWKNTPKQNNFLKYWLTPNEPTFGNAYQSALKAGFSNNYAKIITSDAQGLEWVKEGRKYLTNLEPHHTIKKLEHEALHANQSRDRLKALELIGKIQGLFVDRSISHVDVTFTNDMPRPVIEVTEQE